MKRLAVAAWLFVWPLLALGLGAALAFYAYFGPLGPIWCPALTAIALAGIAVFLVAADVERTDVLSRN